MDDLEAPDGEKIEEILEVFLRNDCRNKYRKIDSNNGYPSSFSDTHAFSWCPKTNICAISFVSSVLAKSVTKDAPYCIPVYLLDLENPLHFSVLEVLTDGPGIYMKKILFSPLNQSRCILFLDSCGNCSIYSQVYENISVAKSIDNWDKEFSFKQDPNAILKWISSHPKYLCPLENSNRKKTSYEEYFLNPKPKTATSWIDGNLLCFISIFLSGHVQIYWKSLTHFGNQSPATWHSSNLTPLQSNPIVPIAAADAALTMEGDLVIAAITSSMPSFVYFWMVLPEDKISEPHKNEANTELSTLKNASSWEPKPFSRVVSNKWTKLSPLPEAILNFVSPVCATSEKDTEGTINSNGNVKDEKVVKEEKEENERDAEGKEKDKRQQQQQQQLKTHLQENGSLLGKRKLDESVKDMTENQSVRERNERERKFVENDKLTLKCTRLACVDVFSNEHEENSLNVENGADEGNKRDEKDDMEEIYSDQKIVNVVLHSSNPLTSFIVLTSKEYFDTFDGIKYMYTVQKWSREKITPELSLHNVECHSWKLSKERKLTKSNSNFGFEVDLFSNYNASENQMSYSNQCEDVAVSLPSGKIYILNECEFDFTLKIDLNLLSSANFCFCFSPNSVCCGVVFDSRLKIFAIPMQKKLPREDGVVNSVERHLANKIELGWLLNSHSWDLVAHSKFISNEANSSILEILALLDSDFHSLVSHNQRNYYCNKLDKTKCQLLEGIDGTDVRALILDLQCRSMLFMFDHCIRSSLIQPSNLVPQPWIASSETLKYLSTEALSVYPPLVPLVHGYVDGVLDLASHFLTRLRRYISFCKSIAHSSLSSSIHPHPSSSSHVPTNSNRIQNQNQTQPENPSQRIQIPNPIPAKPVPATTSELKSMPENKETQTENKESKPLLPSVTPGATSLSSLTSLSISSSIFSSIPGLRLMGDRFFLHKICQLVFFCLVYRCSSPPPPPNGRSSITTPHDPPRKPAVHSAVASSSSPQTQLPDSGQIHMLPRGNSMSVTSTQSPGTMARGSNISGVPSVSGGAPATSGLVPRSASGGLVPTSVKSSMSAKFSLQDRSIRLGNGNGGIGYTPDEVKAMYLVCNELCKRTHNFQVSLPPALPAGSQKSVQLHYPDGYMAISPETIDSWIQSQLQNLPRPRGADAGGQLIRELELNPYYDQNGKVKRKWAPQVQDSLDARGAGSASTRKSLDNHPMSEVEFGGPSTMWKRKYVERNVACGYLLPPSLLSANALSGILGLRRDVITATWKNPPFANWFQCTRCGRHTCSLLPASSQTASPPPPSQSSAPPIQGLPPASPPAQETAKLLESKDGCEESSKEEVSANNSHEKYHYAQFAFGCPICDGQWELVM